MVHQDTHYYLYKKEFTNQASAKKQLINVKRELSFQQVICYLSFRWVNISQAWTVYSVNITAFPFHASKPNVYSSASQASSLAFFFFCRLVIWHSWLIANEWRSGLGRKAIAVINVFWILFQEFTVHACKGLLTQNSDSKWLVEMTIYSLQLIIIRFSLERLKTKWLITLKP